jgi:hypothetical protein
MKKLYPFLAVFATPAILILMSYSSGSPGGKTGSPGDNGTTCTQCHTGAATAVTGWISTNIPPEGYTPGETYTITATGTHAGVVKFGFELTVENSQGLKTGTLQLTEPARTKLVNSSHAVTHTSGGTTPSGNTNTWTVNWVAPSGVTGNIGMYAAFNAANGNGNTGGDVIYKSSAFISEAVPPAILVSIVPDNADQGQTVSTTITGSNTQFAGSPVAYLSYSLNEMETIDATGVIVVTTNQLQADFSIPSTASTGLWDLHVDDLVLHDAFIVNLFTGISDNSAGKSRIYPNPADQHFFIENANGSEISIYNTKGEMLNSLYIINDKQQVDIRSLSRGLYFVNVRKGSEIRVEKLLVN